ncbi:MAG: SRPBCC family protein [Chloroflexi bacterium]|nr:MAG: SRPBCC family protein [Chloroflexota bacterium]
MGQQLPHLQISRLCKARPEAVYDLVADLQSHLEWAGVRQTRDFHLVTLEAPPGPATVGTTFSSTGVIPMSGRRWSDRSTVTAADRPLNFEITTQARAGERRAMTAVYRHSYEISPAAGGSRVTYTMTQLSITNPMLRWALPGMGRMTWLMTPMYAGRGLRNLLALAEERDVVAGSPMHTKEI